MSKFIVLFCLSLVLQTSLMSQELVRKGTFGIQMEADPNGNGVKVLKVFNNSTASSLKMKSGDLIRSVNDVEYKEVNPLVAAVGKWKAGEKITVKIERADQQQILTGKIVGKPLETSDYGEVIYGSVDFDGGKLRSILELPKGVKNPPVIFFLPGIGCGSLDYYYNPNASTKLLVEEWMKSGIAVYRVEKPGMGDSYGTIPCQKMDFDYEVAAFSKALQKLKKMDQIDSNNIFLYGHSLGTVSAPLVAQSAKVKGIIAWGGISKSWYEYSLKILKDQKLLFGQDYVEVERNFRKLHPFYIDFYVNKRTPEELKTDERYASFASDFFQGEMWFGVHHYTYFHTLNDVDILTAYKRADCPVLTLAGEFDVHAIDTDWAVEIANAVNFYRDQTAKSIIVPKTTHHYHTVPSIAAYNELRNTNTLTSDYVSEHFNSAIPALVSDWVKETMETEG